jgi:hypothetical protein
MAGVPSRSIYKYSMIGSSSGYSRVDGLDMDMHLDDAVIRN